MKALGDYIHSKGLLFGLYSSAGTMTCAEHAGGMGYEMVDAHDYASWGVDYLKYDNCFNEDVPGQVRYPAMRDALNSTGRPIYFSICNWGEEDITLWGSEVGNSWRTTQDIYHTWGSLEFNFKFNHLSRNQAGPGGWNDPDMLEVGNDGLTYEEEKTHFALWTVAKSPLILGCDLDKLTPEQFDIISNTEMIAVNQDPESEQAECVLGCGFWDMFMRRPQVYLTTLSTKETVIAVVNWRETEWHDLDINFSEIGILLEKGDVLKVRDIQNREDVGTFYYGDKSSSISIDALPGHGSRVLKFSKQI